MTQTMQNEHLDVRRIMAQPMKIKKMSKAAYRMHIFGIFAQVIRSLMFNFLVLFIGISIGMGFTIVNVQKAWKDKCQYDIMIKLQHTLKKHNFFNKDIEKILVEFEDQQIDQTNNIAKAAK